MRPRLVVRRTAPACIDAGRSRADIDAGSTARLGSSLVAAVSYPWLCLVVRGRLALYEEARPHRSRGGWRSSGWG